MTGAGRNGKLRVVCFDVDGTLVHHAEGKTVWQVLNERFLGSDARNTERLLLFQAGRLAYDEWVRLDITDWIDRDVRRDDIETAIRDTLTLVPGALETMDTLRRRGYGLAIVSGTLDVTLELLLGGFTFDHVYSNRIHFADDGRIASWSATRYDVEGKARALAEIAAAFGVTPADCAFVGDHWNDLPALRLAGLAVAFCPKDDVVRQAAHVVIENGPLTNLLPHFPEIERG